MTWPQPRRAPRLSKPLSSPRSPGGHLTPGCPPQRLSSHQLAPERPFHTPPSHSHQRLPQAPRLSGSSTALGDPPCSRTPVLGQSPTACPPQPPDPCCQPTLAGPAVQTSAHLPGRRATGCTLPQQGPSAGSHSLRRPEASRGPVPPVLPEDPLHTPQGSPPTNMQWRSLGLEGSRATEPGTGTRSGALPGTAAQCEHGPALPRARPAPEGYEALPSHSV